MIQPRLKIIRGAGYITQLIDRRSGGTDPGIGERANSLLAAAELPVPTAAAARVRDAVHEGRGPKSVGQIGEETALENKILWPALARLVVAGEAAVALGWRLWRETAVMSLADPTDRAIAALATSPFAPYALPKIGSLTDSPNERSWH